MNSAFDWDSPIKSPAYAEGYVHFKEREMNKSMVAVIDVREVVTLGSKKMKKGKVVEVQPKIVPYAWTIVPIFTYEGYTNSGVYQIPLMKGAVNENVLKSVASETRPWKCFMDFVHEIDYDTGKPTLEMLRPASAIVRLIDGQREGHFQIPFDWRRLDYSYLP